jgi:hypothetical protein
MECLSVRAAASPVLGHHRGHSFRRTDPDFEAKKVRVLELYEIADGKAKPKDEFGPLKLSPQRANSGYRRSSMEKNQAKSQGAAAAPQFSIRD